MKNKKVKKRKRKRKEIHERKCMERMEGKERGKDG